METWSASTVHDSVCIRGVFHAYISVFKPLGFGQFLSRMLERLVLKTGNPAPGSDLSTKFWIQVFGRSCFGMGVCRESFMSFHVSVY